MQRILSIAILLMCLVVQPETMARSVYIIPQWHTESSDFRHATSDTNGNLTDSYTHMGCDTVNMIDLGVQGLYDLCIYMDITNLHEKSYTKYAQYYHDEKGKIKKGPMVERPIYGWVVGMQDMQHYNVILMRATAQDDELYESNNIEYRVATINAGDTTYHCEWKETPRYNLVSKSSQNYMWLQYNNNTLWFGGGYIDEVPWDIVYNLPSFGPYTGLYLTAGSEVKVENAAILVEDKETQPHLGLTSSLLDYYFGNNVCSFVEGFWDVTLEQLPVNRIKMGGKYSLAVVCDGYKYYMVYISGADIYPGKWREGDVKAIMTPSEAGHYDVVWYDAEGHKMENALAFLNGNELIIYFNDEDSRLILTRSKQYIPPPPAMRRMSGSGFALTTDGYIATNHHVIRNAQDIKVYCMGSSFQERFYADVVAVDSIHDLAIIHINDDNFVGFNELPYSISDRIVRKGEEVFYMGYPDPGRFTSEIKTAKGEITAINPSGPNYTTSVDVEHGSSGSPLFDSNGNVIGVIVSILPGRLTNLEIDHAVKAKYLLKLIEKTDGIHLQHNNKIKELSHPDRIEAIAPYVFLLEVTI